MDEGSGPKSSKFKQICICVALSQRAFFIKKDQLGQNWSGSDSNVDSNSH